MTKIKRVVDIVLGTALLVAASPILAVAAAAIKIESKGPALYKQVRVGRCGETFTIVKLRSMTTDAEVNGVAQWAQKQDPRITRVGKFIRSTRIDELPQLVNIIAGQMSLVGPRPERPQFVDQFNESIPNYRDRSLVKPGLTGLAQVKYPYGASEEDARNKLVFDLYYIRNYSVVLDLMILLLTIKVVFLREGAR